MKPLRHAYTVALLGLSGILSSAACESSGSGEATAGLGGDGATQAQPHDGGDATTQAQEGAPVWLPDSARIDVQCGGFWQGSMRFRADRAQLTSAELDLLGGLRTVAAGPACWADTLGCSLDVTDAAGHMTTYLALEEDANCGKGGTLVQFATLQPFLRALSCQYAHGSTATAPALPRDARCWNGVFTSKPEVISRTLHVEQGQTTGQVELLDCASANRIGKLSFTIVDPSTGADVVAGTKVAATTADQPCVQATPTFPHEGDYTLQISVDAGFLPLGDFWARYY
jgi:hypothetical protein